VLIREFAASLGEAPPGLTESPTEGANAILWQRGAGTAPFNVHIEPAKEERRRHNRKYAEGNLPPERSFYFRGPDGKLNLRAQNLILFTQLADGVDDITWLHHLRQRDYSRWFRESIKDDYLAKQTTEVEAIESIDAAASKKRIRELIEEHYTVPETPPLPIPGTDAATAPTPPQGQVDGRPASRRQG
jgi:hypothetical protein